MTDVCPNQKKKNSYGPGSQHGGIPGPLHNMGSERGVTAVAETCDVQVKKSV